MAYFGAPIPSADHAVQAVSAAIEIRKAIAARNQQIKADGTPERLAVELGIGIHTGPVVVGNIGSDHRTDFTAIGDSRPFPARADIPGIIIGQAEPLAPPPRKAAG